MYVRWKKRVLRRSLGQHLSRKEGDTWHYEPKPPDHLLSAVLVENRRVDGKPRQRVVRYLSSTKESMLGEIIWQDHFWREVDWHLEDLKLEDGDRAAITAKLIGTVPRPDPVAVQKRREWGERYFAARPG